MYEGLSQDLSLDGTDGPKVFEDPMRTSQYPDVKLIQSEVDKGWIVMIWENRVGRKRGCSRSSAPSLTGCLSGTESLTDNLSTGFVTDVSLTWSCQVCWPGDQFSGSRKCRSGKGQVEFIFFINKGQWRNR